MTIRVSGWLIIALAVAAFAAAIAALISRNTDDQRWPTLLLEPLAAPGAQLSTDSFAREPGIVNFWASWCVACRAEHPVLESAARQVPVFGVNHLDQREDALRWIGFFGDPFRANAYDPSGDIGAAVDVPALPVTLVVDGNGRIRYRHSGPLSESALEQVVIPLIGELKEEQCRAQDEPAATCGR